MQYWSEGVFQAKRLTFLQLLSRTQAYFGGNRPPDWSILVRSAISISPALRSSDCMTD